MPGRGGGCGVGAVCGGRGVHGVGVSVVWGSVVWGGGGGPPRRHVHDSIRPIRLTVALGLKMQQSRHCVSGQKWNHRSDCEASQEK